jgi:hypothetical protein
MSEKRHDSDPTVAIPASRMRELLEAEGHAPVPDDDTPTSPDALAGFDPDEVPTEPAIPLCPQCKGTRKTIQETATGYHGPVDCPLCVTPAVPS